MPVAYSATSNNARRTSQPSTSTTSPNATSPASPSPSSSAAAIANTVASPASASATVTPPRTKILLVGLRRSGKSSIREVLFADMPPKETFYLEPTMRTRKTVYDTLIPLEIWDCPGTTTAENLGAPLSQFNALIFVIDMRDLYTQPISRLVEWITAATRDAPNLNLEVFVHKAEKLPEDDKIENFRQIQERVADRLLDISALYESVPLNFHLTSIYDHSLRESFSRVLHKLIPSLPYLEELLNVFCANSQSPKAFLFDVHSRLYLATDASPVDAATHGLFCDWLELLNAFGGLFKYVRIMGCYARADHRPDLQLHRHGPRSHRSLPQIHPRITALPSSRLPCRAQDPPPQASSAARQRTVEARAAQAAH
ncbi:uncharacterized protein SCHCODRAFT_02501536 [Schizophyllum commune H4-8]|nr:uncharacterized protein SCHCODRAFT_02501536 [Schizophyllum commune H4-8]KAI5893634.1 hypothetical protein SCHCODRAFT_02501536 [Schizophyllum commune H4-8]